MSRFISPITNIKPNSTLNFFKSGTNSPLITYKDELESIQNPADVVADSYGNLPNIFFNGSARVVYLDEFSVHYATRDPVGGEKELGDFTLWDAQVTYDKNDIVEGSDGNFYQSLSNANQANDPTTDATNWKEIRFIGVWNTNVTYAVGEVAQTLDGNLWKCSTSNTGSDPSLDSGTNWDVAVSKSNILTDTNTVVTHTGGGALAALKTNELQDAGAYTLPLANSVNANQDMIITQALEFATNEPTVAVAGGDIITVNGTTDTDIIFNQASSKEIRLTSNGVSEWRLTV